ncbi:hypothetical protein [Streptomyces qinglanensis]|uniref:hypothetical protein n=1 Tax=Streptomyces qinglanensis TaxID=943816 RepID=UPI003D734742
MGRLKGDSTTRRKAGCSMIAVGVVSTLLMLVWASGILPTAPARDFLENDAKWVVVVTVLLAGAGATLLWAPSHRERDEQRQRR